MKLTKNGKIESTNLPFQPSNTWNTAQLSAAFNLSEAAIRYKLRILGVNPVMKVRASSSNRGMANLYDEDTIDILEKSSVKVPPGVLTRVQIADRLCLSTQRVITLIVEAGIKPIAIGPHMLHYYSPEAVNILAERQKLPGRPRKWTNSRCVHMVRLHLYPDSSPAEAIRSVLRQLGAENENLEKWLPREITAMDAKALFAKLGLTYSVKERKIVAV